jgi:hypothetical protein
MRRSDPWSVADGSRTKDVGPPQLPPVVPPVADPVVAPVVLPPVPVVEPPVVLLPVVPPVVVPPVVVPPVVVPPVVPVVPPPPRLPPPPPPPPGLRPKRGNAPARLKLLTCGDFPESVTVCAEPVADDLVSRPARPSANALPNATTAIPTAAIRNRGPKRAIP